MNVPNHIAIILDGNGRWARERGMPRTYGHVKGCANLENICYDIKDLGVKYLTVYAFSTENWKRSRDEVEALMKLFRSYLKKCIKISRKNNMRMKVIGDIKAFAPDIQQSVRELEEYSKDFDGIYFQLALNYGSRDEIYDRELPGYSRCSRSGSDDPYQWRAAAFQFPSLAAGLFRVLFHTGSMAGFQQRRAY